MLREIQMISKTFRFQTHETQLHLPFLSPSLGSYDIAEAEGVQRGTKIVVHLRGDCYNFAKEEIIKGTRIVSK